MIQYRYNGSVQIQWFSVDTMVHYKNKGSVLIKWFSIYTMVKHRYNGSVQIPWCSIQIRVQWLSVDTMAQCIYNDSVQIQWSSCQGVLLYCTICFQLTPFASNKQVAEETHVFPLFFRFTIKIPSDHNTYKQAKLASRNFSFAQKHLIAKVHICYSSRSNDFSDVKSAQLSSS